MKAIKYIILSLFFISVLSSCNDLLEKSSHELNPELYFNSDSEANTFLTGVYSPLMQEHFYGSAYPLYIAGGDDLSFYQRSSPVSGGSILTANANSSTTEISNYWRVLYDGINRANMLLEGIEGNPNISEAMFKKATAEALFLRSFYYFHLVQGWGDVPLRLKSVKSPKDANLAKTDKQAIYDKIITDIETALPALPDFTAVKSSGHISKSAAWGILARIYLFRAGEHYRDGLASDPNSAAFFDKARYWANKVYESKIHNLVPSYGRVFLDYSEDKYNSTNIYETIWEVEEAGNRISSGNQSAGRIGNTIGFGAKNDYSSIPEVRDLTGMQNPGYSYRFIFASLKLYEMYEAEGDTMRSNWNIAPYEYDVETTGNKLVNGRIYFEGKKPLGLTNVDGMPCTEEANSPNKTRCAAKYRREHEVITPKNKNYTPINFPILRYSDVLLMLAEAENELNGPDEAEKYLNLVRNRAELGSISGLSKDDFREVIKNERAMELCFEAIRRWDLIRWGEFYDKMREMVDYTQKTGWNSGHKYAANYYKVNKAYVYFPIPDTEISNNKLATQNTGW